MVFRIVIAGETQCLLFAQMCLVADHLTQNLPEFCYVQIEKPVLEWDTWLSKVNVKNGWHHVGSPIIWKELLMKGGNAVYIGGAADFLEYCYSYYNFDCFLTSDKFEGLLDNIEQFKIITKKDKKKVSEIEAKCEVQEAPVKTIFEVCISGASNPLTMYLISALLELAHGDKSISKIYIYDSKCDAEFMELIEMECLFVETNHPGKVVKVVDRIGIALAQTDLLIILDHQPFDKEIPIGEWLNNNKIIMQDIAQTINASASRKMMVILPNLGPACYNAGILRKSVTINKNNIVVATSDLGLEVIPVVAEIAEIPMRYTFCPPVWGFVGINHLVDIRTTVHKYNTFEPYNRYTRVRNSTLNIGSITPNVRTLEYLLYFDESLWMKVTEMKVARSDSQVKINKAVAVIDLLKLWLFDPDSNCVINLGIHCNGSFGLNFQGVFSQPARYVDGEWIPANDFMLPRDPQIKLHYLQEMAEFATKLNESDLPKIEPSNPCFCTSKYYKKKGMW